MKSTGLDAVIIATPFICIITLVAVLFNNNNSHTEQQALQIAQADYELTQACKFAANQIGSEYGFEHENPTLINVLMKNYDKFCD